jgi:hypothetical protein
VLELWVTQFLQLCALRLLNQIVRFGLSMVMVVSR